MVGFGFGTGFGSEFSRFRHYGSGQSVNQSLRPSDNWDGSPSSGFTNIPLDPTRTTAKPVCRLLTPPRQTVRIGHIIGVFAAANNDGSLIENLGLSHVDFHCEGNVVRVDAPSLRTFQRPDGSSYQMLGWWVTLSRPSLSEGIANVYVEAVPRDASMQSRITGPFSYILAGNQFDYDVSVTASGGADFLTMQDAFAHLRVEDAQHPRIRILEAGDYDLESGGGHMPAGWCRIEALAPVTFRQQPPALIGDFTRIRPSMDRLHFTGSEITIDFAETLEFYTEQAEGQHWLDGVNIIQSRGREDLWRLGPRNLVPSLFRNGAWFTNCEVSDVNDVFDKALLVRGCRTSNTWADLAQDAHCVVGNEIENHSSAFYYTNVDAMSIAYSGSGTPTVSIRKSPRSLALRVDGTDVASFTFDASEQGFRNDTNYRVASAVDWVNAQSNWSASLIDDTRKGSALSPPGTTNGKPQEDIAVPATLPTHFDIHSDIYQLPILPELRENVVFSFNTFKQIDAQNIFIQLEPGLQDSIFAGNAFYNNLGTPDEGLRTGLGGMFSHCIFAHNTLASQRVLLPAEGFGGDAYTLIANNVVRRFSVPGGDPLASSVTVANNHVQEDVALPTGTLGTSVGGDSTDLFIDAANGNFTPAGTLLNNGASPILPQDLNLTDFPLIAAKGAVAAQSDPSSEAPPPFWTINPSIIGIPEIGQVLTGEDGTVVDGVVHDRQWLRDGLAIPDAAGTTYTLDNDDEDTVVSYAVEAEGPGGYNSAVSPGIGPIAPEQSSQPSLVDSVKAGGSAGSVNASGLIATGNNRYVFAMVGAGTSDAVNDISCSISGTGGTAAMERVFFRGTNAEPPANAFEAFAGFTIEEAALPGDGPYSLNATAIGANTPDKIGVVAGSVQNAPNPPSVITERSASVSATPTQSDTFVFAGLGSSTGTSGASLTGATQIERLTYGDGLQLGWTVEQATSFTVTNEVNGRSVSALILFAPNE
ncbi:MAG: hypothetical protein AAGI28_01230 [Pseudomonadota bacterium]